MGRDNRDSRSGGSRDRGRGGFGGGRGGGRPTMHKATCSDCGKTCEVPFRPTAEKPVYCSDCFRGHDNENSRGSGGRDRGRRDDGGRRDSGRFGGGDKQMHKAVCDKCGSNCEVPFRPTGDKPIYCSDCFGSEGQSKRGSSKGSDNTTGKLLAEINDKLDRIMKALITDVPVVKHHIKLDDKKGSITKIVKPKRANRKVPSKPKKVNKKKEAKEKVKKATKKIAKKK